MTCPNCQRENRPDARFCDNCGSPVATRDYAPPEELARKLRAAAPAAEGERKQVTVLFADVSGSMDLAESVDPELWRRIMDRFFALLCEGVERYEGTVVQFTGDGVMALFGAPLAHEDHAARAARAALRMVDDLARHAAELRRDEGLNFSVRLGLNSGEVVVGGIGDDLRVEFTAIGHTVGLAKRMESLAEPGTVYLTGRTAALLDGLFELRDLGRFDVKGVREPVPVFRLDGLGPARTRLDVARARGFSRFVGRDRELAVLQDALEDALAGDGRVVGIVGEAGVGKSRLCAEFVEVARGRGLPLFGASGQAHAGAVPFHVALEMMRGYFDVTDATPPQEARERIAGRLLLLDATFGPRLPVVFDFLGVGDPRNPAPTMDPDARRRMLLAGARDLLHAHAEREMAINVIEDLHWVDEASLGFIDALISAVPGHRSLVVVNYRPGYTAAWMRRPEFREIELAALGPEAVDELLADLLGADASLAGLPEEIRRRTGGNPFFVEEVVQALVEDGTLEGPRGARRLARPVEALSVPPSVHGVLAARIDRLAERDKGVLQIASVAGREVPAPLLRRVVDLPGEEVDDALRELVAAGFLMPADGDELRFRHALTQDVAYGSLLAARRREAHGELARAILELEPDRPDERAALLAHHFESAAEALEAMRWHARAAAWVGTRDAVRGAEHWEAVRRLCADTDETPETLGLALAACMWTLQFSWRLGIADDAVDTLYGEARALAERLGDPATELLVTASWAGVVGLSRSMGLVIGELERLRSQVEPMGRPDVEIPILCIVSYGFAVAGRFEDSVAVCERALALLERDRAAGARVVVADPYAWFHFMRGFACMVLGRLAQTAADYARAIELCQASGDIETAGWAHMNHALLAYFSGEDHDCDEHVLRSVEIAESTGSAFSRIWARYNLGVAHVVHERWPEAVATFDDCMDLIAATGTGRECQPWALALQAWARVALGDADGALRDARRAIDIADRLQAGGAFVNTRKALARALAATGDVAGARSVLEDALAVGCARGDGEAPLTLLQLAELADPAEAADLRARAGELFARTGATGHLRALQEWASATPR